MNGFREFAYRHMPYPIQNLLISGYGCYLRSVRYSSDYYQSLRDIGAADSLPQDSIDRLQSITLDRFLRDAVRNTAFYRARHSHILKVPRALDREALRSHFPILEKEEVRAHRNGFISEAVAPRELASVFTSGTTGSPLEVSATRTAIARNYAFFSHFLGQHGLNPFGWSATFAGRLVVPKLQRSPPFWRCNYAMRTWLFSSYHISRDSIQAYISKLERVNPTYIDSYPSSIYAIASYMLENNIKHSVRPVAVVTSSEMLSPHQRDVIETALQCPVFDQYGCAEMAVFAGQCNFGSYHVHPLYGVVEVVNKDGDTCEPGEQGELVVTGLINDAMPLIRYRIGDRARFRPDPCPCGSTYSALSEILGRDDDYVLTPEGELIGRLDPLFKGLMGLVEAQIIQDSQERIEVLIVKDERFDESAELQLIRNLRKRLGERMRIDVKPVEAIPRSANGKFRSVISRVRSSPIRTS